MKRTFSALVIAGLLGSGCTSSVETAGSGGSGSTSSTSPVGDGGDGGDAGGGGSFTIVPGPPEPQCDDASVFIAITGDATLSFDAANVPTGYIDHATGGASEHLVVEAWPATGEALLSVYAYGSQWPGTTAKTGIWLMYADGKYAVSPDQSQSGTLVVTTMQGSHGVIEGSFSGKLAAIKPGSGPAALDITATFRVCRGPDVYLD